MNIVALDIGGSKIEGILWRSGKIVLRLKIKTPQNRKKFLAEVLRLIDQLRGNERIAGVGISLAGAIDVRNNRVSSSPNLPFLKGLNLENAIEKKIGIKTRVLNDAKCFLLGEINFGSAKHKDNVIGIIIGTGFGGALYLDGRLVYGTHGFAGEQGRMSMILGRQNFTVEDLVSSHGFARLGVAKPLDYQNRGFAGDKKAIAIYDQIGKYLGIHLANLIEVFNPQMIVIGGGISRARRLLLKPALKEMAKHVAFSRKYWPKITTSKLENAGLLGAVTLVKK